MKTSAIILTMFSLFILSCNETKNNPISDSKFDNKTELNSEIKTDLEKDYSQSAENFAKEILKDNLRIHHFDLLNSKNPLFIQIFQTDGLENIIGYSNKSYPKKSEPSYYQHFLLFVAIYKDDESANKNFEQLKSDSKFGISINDIEIKPTKSAEFLMIGIKPGGLITKNGKFVFSLVETCRDVPIKGSWNEYENKFIGFITENNQELEVLNSDCGYDKYYLETRKASR